MPPGVVQRNVRLEGDQDLLRRLQALPGAVQRKVLRPAVRAALAPVAVAARIHLAVRARGQGSKTRMTRELERSIGVQVSTAKNGVVVGKVGPRQPRGQDERPDGGTYGGYHGYLVERGHRLVAGGSVARLRGRSLLAPLERRGRSFLWKPYTSTRSKYRKRIRALRDFLGNAGASYGDLNRAITAHAKTGQVSPLLQGAIGTKGLYRMATGVRGHGRVVGSVQGYPFLEPAWAVLRGDVLETLESRIGTGLVAEGSAR